MVNAQKSKRVKKYLQFYKVAFGLSPPYKTIGMLICVDNRSRSRSLALSISMAIFSEQRITRSSGWEILEGSVGWQSIFERSAPEIIARELLRLYLVKHAH